MGRLDPYGSSRLVVAYATRALRAMRRQGADCRFPVSALCARLLPSGFARGDGAAGALQCLRHVLSAAAWRVPLVRDQGLDLPHKTPDSSGGGRVGRLRGGSGRLAVSLPDPPAEQGAEQEARATMSVSPALAAQVTPRVDSSMGGAIVPLDSAADRAAAPAGSLRGDVAVAAPSPTAVTAVEAPAQPQALPDSVQRALERAARLTAPYSGPWTRAVAQSWVNVRAAASLSAAIVGVVTPNTRVELGDSRGAWRRVRSAGFQGWADGAFFDADTSGR